MIRFCILYSSFTLSCIFLVAFISIASGNENFYNNTENEELPKLRLGQSNSLEPEDDMESLIHDSFSRSRRAESGEIPVKILETEGRQNFWTEFALMDTFKTPSIYRQTNADGSPLLSRFRYVSVPLMWSDDDGSNPMDLQSAKDNADAVEKYYDDMSWNQHNLKIIVLPPQKLSGIPSKNPYPEKEEVFAKAKEIALSAGYEEDVHYEGIMFLYRKTAGGCCTIGGGLATVNGRNVRMAHPGGFAVQRHEVGHNYGLPHPQTNKYYFRKVGIDGDYGKDAYEVEPGASWTDGFTMMSGGNGYDIADFSVPSKWVYGWIPGSSIIMMQPEGSTEACPTCKASGSFTIYAFDNRSISPAPGKMMGVHIPIAAQYGQLYSYWLEYRGGNPASAGLSIRLAWLKPGGLFGATYNSLRYDAHGDTESILDSLVLPGTCYEIAPAVKMLLIDPEAVSKIRPVVCVNSMNLGSDITISVSFLEDGEPSIPEEVNTMDVVCGSPVNTSLDSSKYNLLHISGTGNSGLIDLSLCPESGRSSAYFYDTYPHSPLTYNAPEGYGAMKSFSVNALDCCSPGSDIKVDGGTIVKVTNNLNEHLHLMEIEIYNSEGINVALEATCYSYDSKSSEGGPVCLNDGITSGGCISHSRSSSDTNYDFCVLSKPEDIKSIKIYSRESWYNRIRDLQVEIYAEYSGLENVVDRRKELGMVNFYGLLVSYNEVRFSKEQKGPHETNVSISASTFPCPYDTQPRISLEYIPVNNEAFVLISPSVDNNGSITDGFTTVDATSQTTQCSVGQRLENGECVKCDTFHDESCVRGCPDGTVNIYPYSVCKLDETYQETFSSKGWRIWSTNSHTVRYYWYVQELKFYESEDCSGSNIDPSGNPINTRHKGYHPENAFEFDSKWVGFDDDDGFFWLGMNFEQTYHVKCIMINQKYEDQRATEIRVQAFDEGQNKWINVWIEKDLQFGIQYIPLTEPSSNGSPSAAPSGSPTSIPSSNPTSIPSSNPTSIPSAVPTESMCHVNELPKSSQYFMIKSALSTSGTQWCLQPKTSKFNAVIVLKACGNSMSQHWRADKFGQIRARTDDSICIKEKKKKLVINNCADGSSDPQTMFINNSFENTIMWKKNSKLVFSIVGDEPVNNASIKLQLRNYARDSQHWSLDFLPLLILTNTGNPCTPAGKCNVCTGDCDEDSECAGELRCAQRGSGANVPNCDWGDGDDQNETTDYCFLPTFRPGVVSYVGECGVENYLCKKCEGDCDSDDDCEGDLKCFQRNSSGPVPGCTGNGGSLDMDKQDICYDPSDN